MTPMTTLTAGLPFWTGIIEHVAGRRAAMYWRGIAGGDDALMCISVGDAAEVGMLLLDINSGDHSRITHDRTIYIAAVDGFSSFPGAPEAIPAHTAIVYDIHARTASVTGVFVSDGRVLKVRRSLDPLSLVGQELLDAATL